MGLHNQLDIELLTDPCKSKSSQVKVSRLDLFDQTKYEQFLRRMPVLGGFGKQQRSQHSEAGLLLCSQLLKSCIDSKDLFKAKRIHAEILESKHRRSRYLANVLVDVYGKCGSLEDAKRVYQSISIPNMHSWTIMLTTYAQHGHLQEARNMFEAMPDRDVVVWTSMFQACAKYGRLDEAKAMFGAMPDRNEVSWNILMAAYAQNGHLKEAASTFERMPQRDIVSWNAMAVAYTQHEHLQEASTMFEMMPQRNVVSWNAMIAAYIQAGHLENAGRVFQAMPERNIVSWNAMIAAFAQCSNASEARSTFDMTPQKDVVSWTSLIQSYAYSGHNGHFDEAKSMFNRMPNWNVVAWNAMITALTQNGYLEEARVIFNQMPQPDVISWTAMIAAFAQTGHFEEARSMFNTMPLQDVISWNAMIAAYAQNGHCKDALELVQMMDLEGVKPNTVTFVGILTGCSHAGRLEEGRKQFVSMSMTHGITPGFEHYCCMIDLLGRCKEVKEAEDLINDMPFLPDVVAWTALLDACRIHGDVELGARAAQHILELEQINSAPYLLLSNAYSTAGRKEEMGIVWKSMCENGVKKTPGCAVEISSDVHKPNHNHQNHMIGNRQMNLIIQGSKDTSENTRAGIENC